jgi:type IV pilus assembly protein PilM
MLFSKTRSLVGLDIGTTSVKAVEVVERGGEVTVTGFGQVEVAVDTVEARRAAVVDLVNACGFGTRKVVTAISGKNVIVRYLTLPVMGEEEMRNALTFEASKYVPFPLDECVLDCQRLQGGVDRAGDGQMTVVLVAARRSQVVEQMICLEGSHVQADAIDLDVMALGNAFIATTPKDAAEGRISALVDIGATKVSITVVADGTAWFTRELQAGTGRDMTSAVATRLGLGQEEAEAVKRNPEGREHDVADAVAHVVDDLANELQLSFDWFENQFERRIDTLHLSGGGGRLVGLKDHLAKVLGRDVVDFDPFAGMNVDAAVDAELLARNAGRLAIAAGLASRVKKG